MLALTITHCTCKSEELGSCNFSVCGRKRGNNEAIGGDMITEWLRFQSVCQLLHYMKSVKSSTVFVFGSIRAIERYVYLACSCYENGDPT